MISLDMRTIVFSFVLINIVSTVVIIFLWLQYRERYKGIGYLVYAILFQMIAYIFIILRGNIPGWISIEVANVLSILGIYLGYLGFEKYIGQKSSHLIDYILFGFFALIYTWFNYISHDPTVRYFIIAAASFAFFARCAWLLLVKVSASMASLTRFTGWVFTGLCCLAALKIVEFFIQGDKPIDYFQSGSFEAVAMISYQMLIILLTVSLTLMFSNHLLRNIRTEEEKFSTTFHTAPNAIVLSGYPDDRIIEVNDGFTDITGFTAEESEGKVISDISIWKNQQDRIEMLKELIDSGEIHKKEYQLRKKTGEIITGLISAKIISISSEKRIITSIYDITERKNLQEVIRHERNLLRTLIDNLPDPVTLKDNEGKYLLNNQAHLHVIGAESQEEVVGRNAFDFFPEEHAIEYDKDDKSVMKSGKTILDKIEVAEYAETGFTYYHLTSKIPIKDSTGKSVQLLTISHDITERKRSEDALKESYEFNRSLLKTIPFGMDVVDETGTILFLGENFKKIFGSSALGKKCWELYRDDGQQCPGCPLMSGTKTGVTEIFESHGILGGKVFDINHTGMMYHGKKAMLEIFHDITGRKKAEGELIKSKEKAEESDRLKTAFLHNISHEIRTPMNAIVGFANLLHEPGLTFEEQQSFTEIISKSSNHLLSIVNDVIEISNVEAGRMKASADTINIANLLDDLLQQFKPRAAEKGLNLRLNVPEDKSIIEIVSDSTKLIQILSNLLNNAFKFTIAGEIVFGYKSGYDNLEFFVSDTGIGIDGDQQTKIFDRFYQVDNTVSRQHEGTGIGLCISKAYVELLGGRIWVKSATGKGSVFYFTIPLHAKQN
jgi:PAS domain S-box-containing protein